MRKFYVSLLAGLLLYLPLRADEGMWIPILLEKYNLEEMRQAGFRLTAEDIYAVNRASLKDAVVGLGRAGRPFQHFCTGEFVSGEGLLITNHHCVYSMIQSHSTLEHNYLRDGFWAPTRQDELGNPGITASILVRMEDVTAQVLNGVDPSLDAAARERRIGQTIRSLESEAVKGTNLQASIKPYFNGNQYFLSVFKIYRDVRLVGASPSAIGKFGGDTDNWTWPRHTGDFSLLRIYAGADNEPADYSPDNRPYVPDAFLKVSTRGVEEGDFTMVFGYPGTTQEYLPSFAIDQLTQVENPHKVRIRTAKLEVVNEAMASDEALRIRYAAKAAGIANAWKKWQGEIKGLHRFATADTKRDLEARFEQWAAGRGEYAGLVARFRALYAERAPYILASSYASEAGTGGAEIFSLLSAIRRQLEPADAATDWHLLRENLRKEVDGFYKNYDVATDRRILAEMIRLYRDSGLESRWIPEPMRLPKKYRKSGNGARRYAGKLFASSRYTSLKKLYRAIDGLNPETLFKLKNDPLYEMAGELNRFVADELRPELNRIQAELTRLNRLWMAGLLEMQPEKVFYPDANSTFRVSYGKVAGYDALDAVYYRPYTTLAGIMQKEDPAIYDYQVPQRLRELYDTRDFGPYTRNGEVPVCFIATNHTTGGNSGSPVLNADGHLIGLNFDRAWEGVMSDYEYHPEICRNICVDIRYVLFIIDRFAGARHLIDEMELVP